MTTVGKMVDRIRRDLYGGHRPTFNLLKADTDNGTTTGSWSFTYPLGPIMTNAWLSVDDEIVYVLDSNRSGGTATVLRQQLGSTAAVHTAGTVVEVNARFPRDQILDTMLEEILSWPSPIYRIVESSPDLAVVEGTRGYDLSCLPSDFIDVLKVVRSPDVWVGETSNSSWPDIPFRVERNMPVGSFPSGAAIFLERSYKSATTVHLIASRPFATGTWNETVDLEATVGLSSSLLDALKYGTLWRLLSTQEIARTDSSANVDSRSEAAVPGLLQTQSAGALMKIRDRRLADEMARLIALYGAG